jgi:alpha-1,2-mannosyltransferase
MNFFRRIKPEAPVLRNNYFIQVDDNLAWSESIGSEDSDGIGWFTAVCAWEFNSRLLHLLTMRQEKNKAIESHWFRSERQSLRRYVGFAFSRSMLV